MDIRPSRPGFHRAARIRALVLDAHPGVQLRHVGVYACPSALASAPSVRGPSTRRRRRSVDQVNQAGHRIGGNSVTVVLLATWRATMAKRSAARWTRLKRNRPTVSRYGHPSPHPRQRLPTPPPPIEGGRLSVRGRPLRRRRAAARTGDARRRLRGPARLEEGAGGRTSKEGRPDPRGRHGVCRRGRDLLGRGSGGLADDPSRGRNTGSSPDHLYPTRPGRLSRRGGRSTS